MMIGLAAVTQLTLAVLDSIKEPAVVALARTESMPVTVPVYVKVAVPVESVKAEPLAGLTVIEEM
jgi:hypothetical protein